MPSWPCVNSRWCGSTGPACPMCRTQSRRYAVSHHALASWSTMAMSIRHWQMHPSICNVLMCGLTSYMPPSDRRARWRIGNRRKKAVHRFNCACGPVRKTRMPCVLTLPCFAVCVTPRSMWCAWRLPVAMAAMARMMWPQMRPCCPKPWAHQCVCNSAASRNTCGSPKVRRNSCRCLAVCLQTANPAAMTFKRLTRRTVPLLWRCYSRAPSNLWHAVSRWATAQRVRLTTLLICASLSTTCRRYCVRRGCVVCRHCRMPSRTKVSSMNWRLLLRSIPCTTGWRICLTSVPKRCCKPRQTRPVGSRTPGPSNKTPKANGCKDKAWLMHATRTANGRALARLGRLGWPMCKCIKPRVKCRSSASWWGMMRAASSTPKASSNKCMAMCCRPPAAL